MYPCLLSDDLLEVWCETSPKHVFVAVRDGDDRDHSVVLSPLQARSLAKELLKLADLADGRKRGKRT
jgi:hypothetical protein